MDKDKKMPSKADSSKMDRENKTKKEKEKELDDELEQTFPASDPPSHSDPEREKKERR